MLFSVDANKKEVTASKSENKLEKQRKPNFFWPYQANPLSPIALVMAVVVVAGGSRPALKQP